jgi:hypothetical protein
VRLLASHQLSGPAAN